MKVLEPVSEIPPNPKAAGSSAYAALIKSCLESEHGKWIPVEFGSRQEALRAYMAIRTRREYRNANPHPLQLCVRKETLFIRKAPLAQ
jgi:hypothetical protein